MNRIGIQTQGLVTDLAPEAGFRMISEAGFQCADFSLHQYLKNTELYQGGRNAFFDRSPQELERFFAPHRAGAQAAGVEIHQMHMPYPLYIYGAEDLNQYLWHTVAPKSLAVCAFLGCRHIVVHSWKLPEAVGAADAAQARTEQFLQTLIPAAKEQNVTVCLENLYTGPQGQIMDGPCTDPDGTADWLDRLNDRAGDEIFGFCLDTGHANLLGIDFESFLSRVGRRLKVLHIHDNDGLSDLHQIPFTFTRTRDNTSSTDWDGFLRGLKRIRYDGVLSFETSPALSTFPPAVRPDALRFIQKIGCYFAQELSSGK